MELVLEIDVAIPDVKLSDMFVNIHICIIHRPEKNVNAAQSPFYDNRKNVRKIGKKGEKKRKTDKFFVDSR